MAALIDSFLTWSPALASWAIYAAGAAFYFVPRLRPWPAKKIFLALTWAAMGGRLLYAALASVGQFYLWVGNDFTRGLLAAPVDARVVPTLLRLIPNFAENPLGYFLVYSWGRFWLSPLLAIMVALAFYWFLRVLERYQARFFEEGETELGLFAALLAGWPGFVIFLPFVFVSVVLISLIRLVAFKEAYTTLGIPLLLAACVALLWGDALISFFDLWVLRV